MITEIKTTCATCPLAQHIDGNRYVCTAPALQVSGSETVVRGHWQATADCDRAIQEQAQEPEADANYVMQLEANLERSESRSQQQQQFSQAAAVASYGIEVDSIKPDSYRIWVGSSLLGTMRRTPTGWLAHANGMKSWHATPNEAQHAVVEAALAY